MLTPMSRSRRDDESTQPFAIGVEGNDLFHRAMFAIGLSSTAVSAVLAATLRAIGSSPSTLTIEDLGAMLPEIERRLRLLAPHDEVVKAMKRLQKLVMHWEG
jgi:hypothetical protein